MTKIDYSEFFTTTPINNDVRVDEPAVSYILKYLNTYDVAPIRNNDVIVNLINKLRNGARCENEIKTKLTSSMLYLILSENMLKLCYDKTRVGEYIDEATIALMNAIDSYSIDSNTTFFAYAKTCIARHIPGFFDDDRLIRIKSSTVNTQIKKLKKYLDSCDYNPSFDEISDALGISIEKTSELMRILNTTSTPVSFDNYFLNNDEPVENYFTTSESINTYNEFMYSYDFNCSINEIETLLKNYNYGKNPRRDVEIFMLKYNKKMKNDYELAAHFNMTRQNVNKIHDKILVYLQNELDNKNPKLAA